MAWRWRPPWTPKHSAPDKRSERSQTSTRVTIMIVIGVVIAVLAVAVWYSQ